jgi:hypothetical protein
MKADPKHASVTIDAAFRTYAELLLRRHRCLLERREEDPETGEIEQALSAGWETLDEAQRDSLSGMGSDLNWVRRRGAPPPRGHAADAVTEEHRRRLAVAESQSDWHAVLHLLRVCAPVLAVEDLARRRSAAYVGIGLSSYAEVFRDLAGSGSGPVFVPDRSELKSQPGVESQNR